MDIEHSLLSKSNKETVQALNCRTSSFCFQLERRKVYVTSVAFSKCNSDIRSRSESVCGIWGWVSARLMPDSPLAKPFFLHNLHYNFPPLLISSLHIGEEVDAIRTTYTGCRIFNFSLRCRVSFKPLNDCKKERETAAKTLNVGEDTSIQYIYTYWYW